MALGRITKLVDGAELLAAAFLACAVLAAGIGSFQLPHRQSMVAEYVVIVTIEVKLARVVGKYGNHLRVIIVVAHKMQLGEVFSGGQ